MGSCARWFRSGCLVTRVASSGVGRRRRGARYASYSSHGRRSLGGAPRGLGPRSTGLAVTGLTGRRPPAPGGGAMTPRGRALAVGVLTPPAWLLWAERLDAGWPTVLASAGLWWLAALQATWRVWLPAAETLGALWLALPPRPPRWTAAREPAAPPLPPPVGTGAVAGADGSTGDPPDPARRGAARASGSPTS
jgi:hypothetical protein